MEKLRKISSSSLYGDSVSCSQESILSAMERFMTSVDKMNNVVMVPSKLYDLDDDQDSKSVSSDDSGSNSGSNLYEHYKMLVHAKEDIMWGNATHPVSSDYSGSQFRYHLQQLQQMLNHFSDMAHHLSEKYASETGVDR